MELREDIRIDLVVLIAILTCLLVGVFTYASSSKPAGDSPPLNDGNVVSNSSDAPLEGCLKCHDQIEPMHRFGPTATLDKLDNGKDALGLTCTACHGGNPIAIEKETAHVRPRFPREWMRDGKFRVPE